MKKTAIRKSFERHYHRNEQRAARYAALKRRAAASHNLQHDNSRLRRLVVRLQQQLDQSRSEAQSEKDRAVKLGAECDRLHGVKNQPLARQNKYDAMEEFVACMRQQPIDQALFAATWALCNVMAKFIVEDGVEQDVRSKLSHVISYLVGTHPEVLVALYLLREQLGDVVDSMAGAFDSRGMNLEELLKTPLPLLEGRTL